jgi:signal-transduction protein with cAMP-binding, CBS, and nucleotidyltransferase domain
MDMSRVSELMTKDVICTVGKGASVQEAAERMKNLGRGCLIVIDNGKLGGIITERDLVQRVMAEKLPPGKTKVSQIMSTPVITTGPEALVSDAAKLMTENKIRRLVVTEGERVVGVLTVSDFASHLRRKGRSDPMLAAMARAAQMEYNY